MSRIQNILVPLDGSGPSLLALEHALDLASELAASVHALSVEDASAPHAVAHDGAALGTAVANAQSRLGPRFTHAVTHGETLRTILRAAEDGRFDLVVMGTHARVGRLRSVLGSLTSEVARNAHCPVMTVRAPSGAEESFTDRRHRVPSIGEQTRR